jgi:hypothetical protein
MTSGPPLDERGKKYRSVYKTVTDAYADRRCNCHDGLRAVGPP